MSQIKIPIHTNPFTTASYNIMERVAIDTIGPLPSDDDDNKHLIVIIDCFSRYINIYPARDTTALSAARALLQFFGMFGNPRQIVSDNGSQYVNMLIKEFLMLVGTEHVLTMAYSKEENGLVERANKEVMRHLRAIIYDRRMIAAWRDYVPLVQRIINAEVHSSIGVSPAQIVFGNAINLDRGLFSEKPQLPVEESKMSQWTSKMLKAQAALVQLAQNTQQKKDMHHIATHHRDKSTEFKDNDYVLVQYEQEGHKPPSKAHTQYKGPFRVVNHVKSIYTVQNLVTNKLEDYHVKNLKPFLYDPETTDPRDVANRDQFAWDVEAILSHKGDPNKVSSLRFKVHWKGFPVEEATWEPWKNVRALEVLHEYLAQKGLRKLIPLQYRT